MPCTRKISREKGREGGRRMGKMLLSKPSLVPAFCWEEGKPCGKKIISSLKAGENKLVCVTDGNSFLGSHIVKELLSRGHLVRVTVHNQVDFEDLKGLIKEEDMNKLESVVVAKMKDLDSLCDAFSGCHAVFHTSSFLDPHGITGYSEQMAFLETEGARNVIEACGRAAYRRRCIFTSSLLASTWTSSNLDRVIDESCWSSEEFCRENKLWLALGKMRAEKIAWRKSKEMKVKLVTVCPGLLIDSSFPHDHKETSFPYLKGGSIMLRQGLLALADVGKVAEAHVRVYEAMDNGAYGRYLCFERVVQRLDEAIQLENELKIQGLLSEGTSRIISEEIQSNLSNSKLNRLLFAAPHMSCNQ
ncbi:cinnamoyl-CoA reductase-like SNL6 isoform X2 [Populus trichocarpa]|uniref:3-beta hydroxysteroid dehydrogenase/isomerase domain-containing protein n=2 Tax=Populus trichocarpa TaxID=3694 RepID=A0A2K2AST2_POPTR|nr:cinnamoyl-CoA reductase-like SNL6 isoform X2 [Populus trichocarpa]